MKFAIFFCLLIAGAYGASVPPTDAGFWDSLKEKANQYKDEITKVVQNAVEAVEEKVNEAKESAMRMVEDLQKKAQEVVDEVKNRVAEAKKKIDEKVDELTGKAPGVDVTECTEMASEMVEAANIVVEDVTKCVTDKVEEGNKRVESISAIAENLYNKAAEIGTKGSDCVNNLTNPMKIVACLSGVLRDSYNLARQEGPAVVQEIYEVTKYLSTLTYDVASCAATKSVGNIVESVDLLMPSIEACIEQKIKEAEDEATGTTAASF